MKTESEKYNGILRILRKSKPVMGSTEEIEEMVITRIILTTRKAKPSFSIFDFMFRWVYVEWVRKSLIAASGLIIIAFGCQQAMILKQVNSLAARTIYNENLMFMGNTDEIADKLLLYKFTNRKTRDKQIKISERQMKRLIDAVNELQIKYDDLIRVIEENPELKKYFDEKISENNRKKLNL
jgi:hypothetical protein